MMFHLNIERNQILRISAAAFFAFLMLFIAGSYRKVYALPDNVVRVSAGFEGTAFITESGELYTCGRNNFGQLGDGTTESSLVPKKVLSGCKAVYAGYAHSAAKTKQSQKQWINKSILKTNCKNHTSQSYNNV